METPKRRGRKIGSKGKCSICWSHGILNYSHNARTCSMVKKVEAADDENKKSNKKSVSTPPRDLTPHFDEQYREAVTPSRTLSYVRRSTRIVSAAENAPPSKSEADKLSSWFEKKCNIWEDKKPSAKSYGECLICLDKMYKGDIMVLGCGHKFHIKCAQELYRRGDNKCPECRRPGAFSTLLRPEPPIDKSKSLQIKYQTQLQKNYVMRKQLKQLQQDKDKWEREARSLWEQFVTDELIESDFIWRVRAKKYI